MARISEFIVGEAPYTRGASPYSCEVPPDMARISDCIVGEAPYTREAPPYRARISDYIEVEAPSTAFSVALHRQNLSEQEGIPMIPTAQEGAN